MGARGPAPRPTSIKLLNGERPDRINHREPMPAAVTSPEAPPDLPEPVAAAWNRLAPGLWKQGVLTSWDLDALLTLCEAIVARTWALEILHQEGYLIDGDRGHRVKHPAWQIFRDASQVQARYSARFGLTPADRSNLEIPEGHPEDVVDDLLRRPS